MSKYLGIEIDYTRDNTIPEKGLEMLTKNGFYKKPNEDSPQESFARAATCFSFGDYELAQRVYDGISKRWGMYASPVLSNAVDVNWPVFTKEEFEQAGDWLENNVKPDGLPISCFLVKIPDTKEGLVAASAEAKWLSMMGGGIGIYSANRSPDEKSTGVMAHLKGYDADTLAYKQTASRRGSIGAYLDIDHPEIHTFLQMRNPVGGDMNKKCFNLNNAVNINDKFMNAVISGEKYELIDPKHGNTGNFLDAREVWEEILKLRYETGEPYLNFVDTVNRNLPKQIKNPLYKVVQSNLCVAPETLILTRQGYIPIEELEDCDVDVWNGEDWSEVFPKKTGTNQKLLKVTTSAGQTLECTEYHKWYVFNGYGKPYVEKRTYELLEGDKLIKFDLPVIEGVTTLSFAYDNGFYSGDGTCIKGNSYIYLYHEKKDLKDEFESVLKWRDDEKSERLFGRARGLQEKFFVPSSDYTIESRLGWLAGFLDADGCIYRNGSNEAITACSINLTFLQEIQMMLQTLGVSCKISKLIDSGMRLLPANDGSGENKLFNCQEAYRLLITSYDSFKLVSLGLNTKRLKITKRRPQRDAKRFNSVVSVVDEGRFDDTYCFTEPKRGMGVFNGILTGNCNEIHLMTSDKRTAVCCLSSLNLDTYDEWKDTTWVSDMTRFLDNVLEYFIRLAPKDKLQRAIYSAKKERALGLGTLGYHSYLQRKNIAFESQEAASTTYYLYKSIKEQAEKASMQLAVERGESPDCVGSGFRNSHLLSVAPNASSADLLKVTPSREPQAGNAYNSQGRAGSFLIKNDHLANLLEVKGYNDSATWNSIIKNNGSVSHLDFLTDHEKNVYKAGKEINPMWIVELAAIAQEHICQGQSINIQVPNTITKQEMSDIHILAWKKGLKGLYYCRTEAAEKVDVGTGGDKPLNSVPVKFKIEYQECLSCSG